MEDYWIYNKTYEASGGTFRVDKRVCKLSKYIQEKNEAGIRVENDNFVKDNNTPKK